MLGYILNNSKPFLDIWTIVFALGSGVIAAGLSFWPILHAKLLDDGKAHVVPKQPRDAIVCFLIASVLSCVAMIFHEFDWLTMIIVGVITFEAYCDFKAQHGYYMFLWITAILTLVLYVIFSRGFLGYVPLFVAATLIIIAAIGGIPIVLKPIDSLGILTIFAYTAIVVDGAFELSAGWLDFKIACWICLFLLSAILATIGGTVNFIRKRKADKSIKRSEWFKSKYRFLPTLLVSFAIVIIIF